MTRTPLDFPDAVSQPTPGAKPTRSAPPVRPAGGLLTPAPAAGSPVSDHAAELRKQTELLRFIAAWVMASGLVSTMAMLAGALVLITRAVDSPGGAVAGVFGILGLVLLLVIAVGLTLTLRRVVFHLFKIRA